MTRACLFVASIFILLVGCSPARPWATATQTAMPPAMATQAPTSDVTNTPADIGPVVIRWGIGLGDGSDPSQAAIENEVVNDFNASQSKIHLISEIVPTDTARDTFATEIAAGEGPDIVGPMDWYDSNVFYGKWLDLAPYITASGFDTNRFEPAMLKAYQNDQGTLGLPFAVYPSAIFYNTALFKKAGLNPLPAKYGDQYKMPDGSMVAWNWECLTKLAKLLTIDSAGKHSGEAGFDKTRIVQYGFSFGWESHPNYWATFMSSGDSLLVPGGSTGSYQAKIPGAWEAAWQWVYDGIFSATPYIPESGIASTPGFDNGNVFASGKLGMLENPSSYLCCLDDLTKAGGKFDFGSMPLGVDGKVAGRVDEETFRIWKDTKHPNEAFTVLTYLVDTGIEKLVVGGSQSNPAYDAIPGVMADRSAWLAAKQVAFPFVKNWDTLLAGLNYPDIPSAKAYMPNMAESWARIRIFGELLVTTKNIDLNQEENNLESDLTGIFNK